MDWNKKITYYTLKEDFEIKTFIDGIDFENNLGKLRPDGTLTIYKGYSWNGCSPKFNYKGLIIGAPEGELNSEGIPKTYIPTLIHDFIYQISPNLPDVARILADMLFYELLVSEDLESAYILYVLVRLWGWKSWGKYRKVS